MSRQYTITFGPKDKTVDGTDLEKARDEYVSELEGMNGNLTEERKEFFRKKIVSQYTGEKELLQGLCEVYAAHVEQNLESSLEMQDIVVDIKDAGESINLTKPEIEKLIKAYPKVQPQGILSWMKYQGILRQLKDPKPEKEEEKKPEPKPE
jgi:hypothetical protein